ncbi:BON domain-containing protein [Acidovorax sp. A1169]|uniref:BON domain-containing protein n=1 Tax=Acidovorax sp. A1169 TaxID=3059524 RepID=UPI002737E460|nr:BON domain-containing protein [Acidovorax sp. A1169]MDP4076391.1 BON domain-containing protein [Acidovorax sp. A1169]
MRKTDSELQQDVIAELNWEPSVHATQIGVEAKDGLVTIVGEVSSQFEKWNAERATERVKGVTAILNDLSVKISELGQRTDADIAFSASNVLRWTTLIPTDAVKVMVENSWITLSGEVQWQFQRQAAANSVRHLPGVMGLINKITIKPAVFTVLVKSDIDSALSRIASTSSKTIAVEVKGANVTLTGTTHSLSEREIASETAWAAPGVRSVINNITIIH